MRKISICVTDAQLFLFLRHILAAEGFSATLATHPDEVCRDAGSPDTAAIVVDCASIRDEPLARAEHLGSVPLILFCRDDEAPPRWLGAQDLLLKRPFDPSTLIGFLRQLSNAPPATSASGGTSLQFADLSMNLPGMSVYRAGRLIPLTVLQFRLLRHLLEKPTAVCDREELIEHCWPPNVEVEPRTVDIHIGHIRRLLCRDGPDIIRTVRGTGYALGPPPAREPGSC